MNDILTLESPAKLNLFLHITGRRPDGYHELQTIFQIIDYCDRLHFKSNDGGILTLHCDIPELSGDDNLILRAARALRDKSGCTLGADITLEKHIPMGAGLGGGSSNAATTLLALNQLWETGLDNEELCAIGVRLGADVPLFVKGQSAWAEGIGEILTPVVLAQKSYLVVTPDCHVSTKDIFSNQQLTRNTTAIKMAAFLAGQTRNDCENIVRRLYPPVDEALKWLNQHVDARMTGTGASVFAGFDSEEEARALLLQLPKGWRAFVARGLQQSAVQKQ
ncbi:MAG: 4-(cytidine 5'-diphospho)-2-C-methyl-D-erythritol kinase [Gammaproteobacteria bacterium]|nr:4-(cytidine 5'-diphospho)-2-C-methyl-D-erythritol kinase [Gammaproteobacteria bacterium]